MKPNELENIGFVSISDSIFSREAGPAPATNTADPELVLLFAWGNALPKHVAKYSEGFSTLYPGAKQIIILSEISTTLYGDLPYRSKAMQPLVRLIGKPGWSHGQRTLVHCMSNTGGIKYAAFLNAYRNTRSTPFPHNLLVLDSTPGSPYLTLSNLKRWSLAMTLNTAAWFPWPALLTQYIWGLFLVLNWLVEKVRQRQSAPVFATLATNDVLYEAREARKLYLYGREDRLIAYTDIEAHAAKAREARYGVEMVVFERSGHVAHMRAFSEKYWSAIEAAWKETV